MVVNDDASTVDPAQEPSRGVVERAALYTGSALAAAVAVLTVIGIQQGAFQRLQRDSGSMVLAAYVFILLAVFLELLAGLKATVRGVRRRERLHAVGLGSLMLGIVVLLFAAVDSLSRTGRPELTATLHHDADRDFVHVEMNVGSLKSDSEVKVAVYAAKRRTSRELDEARQVDKNATEFAKIVLHQAVFGPNADGKVERAFDVPVTAWEYERFSVGVVPAGDTGLEPLKYEGTGTIVSRGLCEQYDFTGPLSACVEFAGIGAFPRPAVELTLPDGSDGDANLSVSQSRAGPASAVEVVVYAVTNSSEHLLYRAVLPPGPDGSIQRQARLSMPPDTKRLCAVATLNVDLAQSRDNLAGRCTSGEAGPETLVIMDTSTRIAQPGGSAEPASPTRTS